MKQMRPMKARSLNRPDGARRERSSLSQAAPFGPATTPFD
jgi:hypothetical protein